MFNMIITLVYVLLLSVLLLLNVTETTDTTVDDADIIIRVAVDT
jgi:hypothetical protein